MNHNEITELLSTKAILDAQNAGRQAAYAGNSVTTCPHGDENDRSHALRAMWVRGYAAGRTRVREQRHQPSKDFPAGGMSPQYS